MEKAQYQLEAYGLINELETMLEGLRKVPLSNAYMIDRDAALGLVQELRDALPVELRDAANLIRQQNRILQNANRQADGAITEAENKARQTLSDAETQSDAMLKDAEQRARERETVSQEQAQRTIESAERRAKELTNQTAILKRAETQAQELISKAQTEAQRIYMMNSDHCESLLQQAENYHIELANQLRRSRSELNEVR